MPSQGLPTSPAGPDQAHCHPHLPQHPRSPLVSPPPQLPLATHTVPGSGQHEKPQEIRGQRKVNEDLGCWGRWGQRGRAVVLIHAGKEGSKHQLSTRMGDSFPSSPCGLEGDKGGWAVNSQNNHTREISLCMGLPAAVRTLAWKEPGPSQRNIPHSLPRHRVPPRGQIQA